MAKIHNGLLFFFLILGLIMTADVFMRLTHKYLHQVLYAALMFTYAAGPSYFMILMAQSTVLLYL